MQAVGGNQSGTSRTQPVPKQGLRTSQERCFTQASNKPETTKPIYGKHPFQDGEFEYDERPAKTGRLDGFDRLEERVPVGLHLEGTPQVSEIHLEQPAVRISVPPIWPVQCPQGLYQAIEASISVAQESFILVLLRSHCFLL